MKRLKQIRILISLLMFLLLTALVADASGMLPHRLSALAKVQIMPAAMSFLFGVLAFWLLMTFVFGRAYCSSVCPMGTLQDIFGRIGKTFRKKQAARYRFSKPRNLLRYSVLALTVAACLAGVSALPALIDPYSAYVRIVAAAARPAAVMTYSGMAGAAVGLLTLAIIGLLSYRNGRTFCNTVCPVGSTLSIVSRHSLLRVQIDSSKCIGCRRCEAACKSSCIDVKNHTVDSSRCVLCFDCSAVCRDDAIVYRRPLPPATDGKPAHPSRRRFVGTVASVAAGILAAEATEAAEKISGTPAARRRFSLTPPGARSKADFLQRCTACHLCVARCPQQVIKPSITEHGLLHILQPTLDYSEAYCIHSCRLCASVCPTGALRDYDSRPAVGKAKFVLADCITQTDGVVCGACSRKCPVGAITLVDYGQAKVPSVNEDACIGCGKCEFVCPASPQKAIYVEGFEN